MRKNFEDLKKASQKDPGNDISHKDNRENLTRLRRYFAARLKLLGSLTDSYKSLGIGYRVGVAEETDQDGVF